MDLDTFIVTTYCFIDDLLEDLLDGRRLRSRGPKPLLDDREVLTIEVVGEFLGMDTEKGIFSFFVRHYEEWFPALGRVHRTTFTRQAANLWAVKRRLWHMALNCTEHAMRPSAWLTPSVCQFARLPRCPGIGALRGWPRAATTP